MAPRCGRTCPLVSNWWSKVDDHCMMPVTDVKELDGEIVARTTQHLLLKKVAADVGQMRVTLFEDGRSKRVMSQVKIERIGEPRNGWFRVVHRDDSLRLLMRQIDLKRR